MALLLIYEKYNAMEKKCQYSGSVLKKICTNLLENIGFLSKFTRILTNFAGYPWKGDVLERASALTINEVFYKMILYNEK